MKISRMHPFTGKTITKELNCTEQEYLAWSHGKLAQNAFKNLNADEREFIISGIDNWDEVFKLPSS